MSYCPLLPKHLQIIVIRVYAANLDIAGIERSVRDFNSNIESLMSDPEGLNQVLLGVAA